MSRLNPLAELAGYVGEVRAGFLTILKTLIALGDLIASGADTPPNSAEAWEEFVASLAREGTL